MKHTLLRGAAAAALVLGLAGTAVAQGASQSAPPGLADKEPLPPGIEKRGGDLPSGLEGRLDTGETTGDGQTAAAGDAEAGADQTAAVSADVSADTLSSAFDNMSAEIAELGGLSDLADEDVRIVKAAAVGGDFDVEGAAAKNEAQISELRGKIEDSSAVKDALEKNNVAVDEVVAVDVGADGKITVFTHGG